MSITVDEWIKYVEQKEGRRPSPTTIRFIERLDQVGQAFESMGKKDFLQGLDALSDEAFAKWGTAQSPKDPRAAELVAELMQMYYMDGYRKGSS